MVRKEGDEEGEFAEEGLQDRKAAADYCEVDFDLRRILTFDRDVTPYLIEDGLTSRWT